ncbi:MAG: hypothetical protein K0R27_5098, partial [Xanthobacteraceae bacterium]|nr:hypothetical protein [Xanthobacteraceae bacterium]
MTAETPAETSADIIDDHAKARVLV